MCKLQAFKSWYVNTGSTFEEISQYPAIAIPGYTVSLSCTVSGTMVSHLCNDTAISNPENGLEWHIPSYRYAIGLSYSEQLTELTFTADCSSGTLSSSLTIMTTEEWKDTAFQCALRIESSITDIVKLWSQAKYLIGKYPELIVIQQTHSSMNSMLE